MTATMQEPPRSGVDVRTLFATIDAVKGSPELARFQFRASNEWISPQAWRTSRPRGVSRLVTPDRRAGRRCAGNGPAAILILRRLAADRRKPPGKSNSGLRVRPPSNALGNASASCGVIASPVAGEGKQHHDAETDSWQARRQGDRLRSVGIPDECRGGRHNA